MWQRELTPGGADVIGSMGNTYQIHEWTKRTGEKALWNPYQFSGTPIYHRQSKSLLNILIEKISVHRGKHFIIYIVLGMSGIYLLLMFWKIPVFGVVLGALAFSFIPKYQIIFYEGHFQHYRALLLGPWVVFSFLYLWEKKTFGGLVFFTLSLSQFVGTLHYQIVFYYFLLCVFLFIGLLLNGKMAEKAGI